MSWYFREYYPRSRPRAARGGIKSQSKRGQFGTSWWAKRWIDVLESFQIGARLQRGRSYARSGQVLNIDVAKGRITAQVQGSRPRPYDVEIQVKVLTAGQWDKLADTLAKEARFVAKLLAGEMPSDIETVFEKAKLSLFPEKLGDLKTSCSCPDYSNPCKHIAAVYYLLGEEFDRDPFLLFRLRGLSREELVERLGEAAGPKQATKTEEEAAEPEAAPAPQGEPLPGDPKAFWSRGDLPDDLFGDVQPPATSGAWLRRLGNFPLWRGVERIQDALEPVYRQAAQRGMETFLGERKP
jgi:uncharacterized Zn finger protein